MDDLTALEEWAGALLSRLDPAARRKIAVDVARELRRSQQKRIKEQRNPDGSAYEARRPRLRERGGRVKQKAMFAKLRTARFLKIETNGSGLGIGFVGRVARLARIHQEGQTSEVQRGGPSHAYPVRQLLGLTNADREMIRDKLLEQLTRG